MTYDDIVKCVLYILVVLITMDEIGPHHFFPIFIRKLALYVRKYIFNVFY